ncbi:hypothetical protein [Simonsiella muelleri]|uniref:hypothetical protein n=1 Tax=Simonsiella muelleri TaxID=72 RepID=UPI0028D32682|nr:hypothetical protein [Simonsiella muelleri]
MSRFGRRIIFRLPERTTHLVKQSAQSFSGSLKKRTIDTIIFLKTTRQPETLFRLPEQLMKAKHT